MLDLNLNILWTFINIIVIFFILKHFLLKPVNDIIKKRQDIINESMNEAEKAKAGAEEFKNKYEETLKGVNAEADAIMEKAKTAAQKEYDSIIESARNDADTIIKNANRSINEEKEKALADLRLNAADMVIMAAQKVAEKSMSEESDRKMVEAFLAEAGDGR